MNKIEVSKDANGRPVELGFEDVGQGPAVVLVHGWPVSHAMWEYQTLALVENGFRVISYDRRGFGASSQPWDGYDYDTLAQDLDTLLAHLTVAETALVGFSMGGGEVARYMAHHASGHSVGKVVFVSAITPYLLKTHDNPDGVDKGVFDEMLTNLEQDRPAFLEEFGKQFFGVGTLAHPVSQAILDWQLSMALPASLKATLDCVHAFSETDFRADLESIRVPTLVIHGKADKTVPLNASGKRTAELVPGARLEVYDDAPHGLHITHREQLNRDLVQFLGA